MITVSCNCGKDVTVADDAAGKTVRCTSCGAEVNIPGSPEPQQPQPRAAAVPQPPPLKPPAAVGYAPEPSAPAEEPAAPEKRRGRVGVIILCILALLTIVVPWDTRGEATQWSWDVLGDSSGSYVNYVIALWAVAFITFVLGCAFAGLILSVPLGVMSAVGMALMFMAFGGEALAKLTEPLRTIGLTSRDAALALTAGLAMFLFIAAAARARAGGAMVLGILQAVASAGTLLMLAILIIPNIQKIVDRLSGIESFGAFAKGDALGLTWILLCLLFLCLAGVVGLIHGLFVNSRRTAPAAAAAALTRLAVVLFALQIVSVPIIGERWEEVLPVVTMDVVVVFAMPMLFCSGVSRAIGDLISGLRKGGGAVLVAD